jgi:uncharacterized membrane protein (GlpM family)
MTQLIIKFAISALVVVAVSELAKRSSIWAALLASLPLTSLLAFVWLRIEGEPVERIATLAGDILWLVLPSLVLFIVFPLLLRNGVNFWISLALGCLGTTVAYAGTLALLRRAGGSA